MNDRYATTRGTTYDGAELKTRSSRPGAYDAFAIPSLMFGKQERPVVAEPAPAPSPTVMPASTPRAPRAAKGTPSIYRPQPGSVGDQVMAHLKKHGGTLTARQIVELCGVERESVAGLMQRARATGAVAHEIRDRKGYYFLPVLSIVTEAATPPPRAHRATDAVGRALDRCPSPEPQRSGRQHCRFREAARAAAGPGAFHR